jgi:hypothetical protein
MDMIGLLNKLTANTIDIDIGRKGFATAGGEQAGRISYERGIAGALTAFQEAHTEADPQMFILAELVFLQQELQFCNESDTETQSSLTQAIQSFNDALRALKRYRTL